MRWGTNGMDGAWVLIGGPMRWGTNEMGDQWDGGPLGLAENGWTNEKGDQWEGGPMSSNNVVGNLWIGGPMRRGPMRWGTNESGGPMRWGTNEMGGAWVLIWGPMRWGTNEMGDQWEGRPIRWGTNDVHPLEARLSRSRVALNLHLLVAQTVPATHVGGAPPCAARTCLLRSHRRRSARSSYCTLFNNRCVLSACSCVSQNMHRRRTSAVRFSAFRLPNPTQTRRREVHGGLWPRL